MQSVATDRQPARQRRSTRPFLLLTLLSLAVPAKVTAQAILRIGTDSVAAIRGADAGGAAAFPAETLQRLGFRLIPNPAGISAVIGTDTLSFWQTSPFFRRGASAHQLAYGVSSVGGRLHLPEQLFIQWLPAAFPDRFAYRNGVLSATTAVARTAAPAPSTPAGQSPPAQTPPAQARSPQTSPAQTRSTQSPPAQTSATTATPQNRAAAPPRAGTRDRVVVIDPGHGGRDPGKVGPNGLREKDVTLLISQRLAAVLQERGYEVHLTRTTDTLIALADRPRMANRWRGDRPVAVFLSIHANAFSSASARGYETFFLSDARTEDERRVAEMENESVRFEDVAPAEASDELGKVLAGLRSDFLMRASHDLAAVMQDRMSAFHPGPDRGVKRAGFVVLIGSIMPAVLIETAFISNREEATLLGSQSFQQKIAWGIADGVDEFFRRNEHLWVQD